MMISEYVAKMQIYKATQWNGDNVKDLIDLIGPDDMILKLELQNCLITVYPGNDKGNYEVLYQYDWLLKTGPMSYTVVNEDDFKERFTDYYTGDDDR